MFASGESSLINLLLNLRSPRDCGSCRPLYSNHATDRPATCAHSSEVASMVADFYGAIQVLRNADGGGGCISGKLFKLLNLRSPWGCISGKLFKLLNLRSARDCGSCRSLYSNHATDRPATCAHSSEVASMVADFYGAIQVLRNGGGGV